MWAHRFMDHAERGVRRIGRAYRQARGVAQRADRMIQRGANAFHAVSHLLPEANKQQDVRGLSAYNQIRSKAMEADRALQTVR